VSGLRGNVSDLRGDVTGLRGNVTDLCGDVDDAKITDAERKKGVDISDITKPAGAKERGV
jgi:hypothetical protein